MKQSVRKLPKFLLEEQLSNARINNLGSSSSKVGAAKKDAQAASSSSNTTPSGFAFSRRSANNHVVQVALETCHCTHLLEFLPHLLDLDLCKAKSHPRGWLVANPVHALHLASQIEESLPVSMHSKEPPLLYGEEQQRTLALSTEGIGDYWCPLDGRSAVVHQHATNKKEHPGSSSTLPRRPHATSNATPTNSTHAVPTANATTRPRNLKTIAKGQRVGDGPMSTSSRTVENKFKAKSVPPAPTPKPTTVTSGDSPVQRPSKLSQMTSSSPIKAADRLKRHSNPLNITSASTASSLKTSGGSPQILSTPSVRLDSKSASPSINLLPDHRYHHLRLEEDRVRLIRRSLSSKRFKKKSSTSKKRKRDSDFYKTPGLPGWRPSTTKELSVSEQEEWHAAGTQAQSKVEQWMGNFRACRQAHLDERNRTTKKSPRRGFFHQYSPDEDVRSCLLCTSSPRRSCTRDECNSRISRRTDEGLTGDDLMQCLECSFIGCSPQSIAPQSRQHILKHLLLSGHTFAVSCGQRGRVFCLKCGDFVYHPVFDQERERMDHAQSLPWMSWNHHVIQRSFDPMQFLRTQDHGIVWRGLVAAYPPLVPDDHVLAVQLSMRRHALFEGRTREKWLLSRSDALAFAAMQGLKDAEDRWRIKAPVGMFNLGNTCFQSAVLQCLVHCMPLQRHFLKESGHHFLSCRVHRKKIAGEMYKGLDTRGTKSELAKSNTAGVSKMNSVCLACQMDRLFLMYYGSTIGNDVAAAIWDSSLPLLTRHGVDIGEVTRDKPNVVMGSPLVASDLLTAAWKSGGMDHLAGYDQRDAHEFLNSFLDLLGKHSRQERERVIRAIKTARGDDGLVLEKCGTQHDIVKHLFEGTLRSVLLCLECGGKRMLLEPFVNISLTLSEEVERLSAERLSSSRNDIQINVETCLEHFILPEKLSDPVHCPACGKKTPTKKQHTFSKLPKVLCLHLKRFDAARNKKINESVSFPADGLNMGPLLSHWCEVTRKLASGPSEPSNATPEILYDLFGTVNHIGTLQSGHYVSNVKVNGLWFHCNDAHVSRAGLEGGESEVLNNEGAYILFYIRR